MFIETRVKHLNDSQEPIDWLMYRSYEHQRNSFPDIDPLRWRELYFNQETYEKIYQGEIECQ